MTTSDTGMDFFGWIPETWRMVPEYDLFGFYYTPVILIILGAILLGGVTAWVGDRLRLERFVWHPPLFLIGLIFVYGFLLSLMFLPR